MKEVARSIWNAAAEPYKQSIDNLNMTIETLIGDNRKLKAELAEAKAERRDCNACAVEINTRLDAAETELEEANKYRFELSTELTAYMIATENLKEQLAIAKETLRVKNMHHEKEIQLSDKRLERLQAAEKDRDELKVKQLKHGKQIDTWRGRAVAHRANCEQLEAELSRYKNNTKEYTVKNTGTTVAIHKGIYVPTPECEVGVLVKHFYQSIFRH